MDVSDNLSAAKTLNLRDYLGFLVNVEGAVCKLVARRFLETMSSISDLMTASLDNDDESVELNFEMPAAPVIRRNQMSPAFSISSPKPTESLNSKTIEECGSVFSKEIRRTPSPSSDVDDAVRRVIANTKADGDEDDDNDDDEIHRTSQGSSGHDSIIDERTPTPEKNENSSLKAENISSKRSSSGAISIPENGNQSVSPSQKFQLSEQKLTVMLSNSSRPTSSTANNPSKGNMPGLFLGSLHTEQNSPHLKVRTNGQRVRSPQNYKTSSLYRHSSSLMATSTCNGKNGNEGKIYDEKIRTGSALETNV